MKKLIFTLFSATLGTTAFAQQPTTVLVVNINTQMVSFLRNAAGFNMANPYAEVMIFNPSPAADGYRIHVTYTDSAGVQHDVLRDAISQPTSDGRVMLEVFSIDAATISVTVTPYKLQVGSIASTP